MISRENLCFELFPDICTGVLNLPNVMLQSRKMHDVLTVLLLFAAVSENSFFLRKA